jgi:hypothetical protein
VSCNSSMPRRRSPLPTRTPSRARGQRARWPCGPCPPRRAGGRGIRPRPRGLKRMFFISIHEP